MNFMQTARLPGHSPTGKEAVLEDSIDRRLGIGLVVSLLANLLLWGAAAAVAVHPVHFHAPAPIEITRVILQPNGKRIEKVIKKEEIKKKFVQVPKELPKPKPVPVVYRERPRTVEPAPHQKRAQIVRHETPRLPMPETAHNRILTAPDNKAAPSPTDHVVPPNGNADVGKPIGQQGTGDARTSPDIVKDPGPQPVPRQEAKPLPLPSGNNKKDVPAPDPPRQPDPPKPPEPPKKKGPTREAEPDDQIKPEIPDDLKHGGFKSFVRVAVNIDADGLFTVTLRTSSGNQEIDNRVLDALKKWKWKPALKNGDPVPSVQRFKFEFLVE